MATPNQYGTPKSGTAGRVQVNAINIALDHWDFEPTADLDDTTTFEDFDSVDGFTYQVDVDGVRRGQGTISGYWNSGNSQFAGAGGGLVKGALVTNMFLYVDRVGNRYFNLPKARIISTPVTVDVAGGKIKFSCRFKSFGNWVDPI